MKVWDSGHLRWPFDAFDLEVLDRLAQGGESFDAAQDREPDERPVEPFRNSYFDIQIFFIGPGFLGNNQIFNSI